MDNMDNITSGIEMLNEWSTFDESNGGANYSFNATALDGGGGELSFENLYPVLLQTFVVIVLGYLSGRWGIIGQTESKGLNTFVGHFALPCIIFTALAELDFSMVNWNFLLALLISKLAVFVAVLVFTLLLTRPMNFSKAGLFAIFCTQSNDFALGYPIVVAVYGTSHPEYAKYLYVMAPISLVLLNPLGFLFLEIGERRKDMSTSNNKPVVPSLASHLEGELTPERHAISRKISSSSTLSLVSNSSQRRNSSGCKVFLEVWKNMLFTPIVLMTVMGIAVNFLCQHQIPPILKNLCGVLSSAFSATALFALGLRMVGKMQDLGGAKFVVPSLLIAVKSLVLPIVTREVTLHLAPGAAANESLELSNLGFLFGTFPSAPGVLFYALQYGCAVDLIATAMVACTFVSAPLTFVSARMVSLSSANPAGYIALLDDFLMRVAIIGLVCTLFIATVFLASRKWQKVPHFATLCLTLSQSMACFGIILWYMLGRDEPWKKHVQFLIFAIGVFSSRVWSAMVAVTLLLLRMKNLSFVLRVRRYIMAIGWGVPMVLAASLCSFGSTRVDIQEENPNFQYGKPQALVASSVLIVSFTVSVVCLVWHQRLKTSTLLPINTPVLPSTFDVRHLSASPSSTSLASSGYSFDAYDQYMPPQSGCSSARTSTTSITSGSSDQYLSRWPITKGSLLIQEAFCGEPYPQNKCATLMVESLFSPCDDPPTQSHSVDIGSVSSLPSHLAPRKSIARHLTEPEEYGIVRDRDDEFQITRHVALMLALCCSMFVGIAVCVWTLVMEELTGIYVMLLFLDETLNFGQGTFVFVLFGLEPRRLFVPVWSGLKRRHKQKKKNSMQTVPEMGSMPPLTVKSTHGPVMEHTCEQFMMFYMDKCIRDLVRDRRWHLKEYSNVFCGSEMVDWLLLMGLASDRGQAEKYGQRLLDGGVIAHVDGRRDFHDHKYFYSFV